MVTVNKHREQKLTCGVEWHLRQHPRAFGVYRLALDLAGEKMFAMSPSQVAAFFGWDVKTVRSAFKVLVNLGWFAPTGIVGAYRAVPHSELYQAEGSCWAGEDRERCRQ
jgi:hypothetical protein